MIYIRRPSFLLNRAYAAVIWVVTKERCVMTQRHRRLHWLETVVPMHVWNIFNFRQRLRADMNYSFRYFVYVYAGYVREINFCFFFVFPLCFILFLFPFVSFHSIPCSQINKLQFLYKLMEALHRSELDLGSYLTLYASGYRMNRFPQVSQTDSCHYSKYVFHVHI